MVEISAIPAKFSAGMSPEQTEAWVRQTASLVLAECQTKKANLLESLAGSILVNVISGYELDRPPKEVFEMVEGLLLVYKRLVSDRMLTAQN